MEARDLRDRAQTLEFRRDLLPVSTLVISGIVYGVGFLVPLTVALLVFVLLTAVIDRVAALRLGNIHAPRWLAVLMSGDGQLGGLEEMPVGVTGERQLSEERSGIS